MLFSCLSVFYCIITEGTKCEVSNYILLRSCTENVLAQYALVLVCIDFHE